MSRFHRVDDIRVLPFARLYRLATRLWMYGGVMAVVARMEQGRSVTAPAEQPARFAPADRALVDRALAPIPGVRSTPGAQFVPPSVIAAKGGGRFRTVSKSA